MWNFIVPAAIGAVTSYAMGDDPLTGAVVGGATGGFLGGGLEGGLFDVGKGAVTNSMTTPTLGGLTLTGAGSGGAASGLASGATSIGVQDLATRDLINSGFKDTAMTMQDIDALTNPVLAEGYDDVLMDRVNNLSTDIVQDNVMPGVGINLDQAAIDDVITPGLSNIYEEAPYMAIRDGVAPDMSFIPGQLGDKFEGVKVQNPYMYTDNSITAPTDLLKTEEPGFFSKAVDYAKENPVKTGIGALGLLSVLDSRRTTLPTNAGSGSIKAGSPDAVKYNQMVSSYTPKQRRQFSLI